MKWRIWGEYFWFWLTLGFSIISYTLLFFWTRGNIHIDEDRWWIVRFQRSQHSPILKSQGIRRQSFIMLSCALSSLLNRNTSLTLELMPPDTPSSTVYQSYPSLLSVSSCSTENAGIDNLVFLRPLSQQQLNSSLYRFTTSVDSSTSSCSF